PGWPSARAGPAASVRCVVVGRCGYAPVPGAGGALMLSRIAESLFWIGRYVERADATSRLVDAYLQHLLEDAWIDEDLALRSLLGVMGLQAGQSDQTR